jgi:predicted GH43/DUF377 family glycosyl hydrolase
VADIARRGIEKQRGIEPDPRRLVARPFLPGAPNFGYEPGRLDLIVDRVLAIPRAEQRRLLDDASDRAAPRFDDVEATWVRNFEMASRYALTLDRVTDHEDKLLVGAFLTQAYAYEAVALTNPSIVPLEPGNRDTQRFVLSARAIGEGHISSIAFITGTVDREGSIELDDRHPHATNGERRFPPFDRTFFAAHLADLDVSGPVVDRVLAALGPTFTDEQLDRALREVTESDFAPADIVDTIRRLHWFATSNYEVVFDTSLPVSEHLLSPAIPTESHGMEDARFVRFVDDDGSVTYYATYTAYDGSRVLPQLIETGDFHSFRIGTLSGPAAHHKGMALFPRKIDGEYVALSRHDQERTFLMRSDDIRTWANAQVLLSPDLSWEVVQTGNCGSPIETERGWLVITHGVGMMRRYVLGAVLLDLDEPAKVVARLDRPLLEPEESESTGLVPDVVYSCGSMIHGDLLVVPYGYADHGIKFATVPVDGVIGEMT